MLISLRWSEGNSACISDIQRNNLSFDDCKRHATMPQPFHLMLLQMKGIRSDRTGTENAEIIRIMCICAKVDCKQPKNHENKQNELNVLGWMWQAFCSAWQLLSGMSWRWLLLLQWSLLPLRHAHHAASVQPLPDLENAVAAKPSLIINACQFIAFTCNSGDTCKATIRQRFGHPMANRSQSLHHICIHIGLVLYRHRYQLVMDTWCVQCLLNCFIKV